MPDRPARVLLRRHWILAVCSTMLCVGLSGQNALSAEHASQRHRSPVVLAVKQVRTAVVNINGEKLANASGDDFSPYESDRPVNGMGTGVVIDSRGYIITNHHVVEGVRQIRITMSDGSTHRGTLISHDPATDLAVIKINDSKPFDRIPIGGSDDLLQGEDVIAVGNAFGYEHTVTLGIISALHRTVQVGESQKYEDLIQTDASINPGNSGGPLLNIDGEMIGINVAVRVGAQNIGFAIPVDTVMKVASDLMSTKRLGRSWHGVSARRKGHSDAAGLVVDSLEDDSPAANSGIRKGDVIKSIAGKSPRRSLDLELALLDRKPGDSVEVKVERGGREMEFEMRLAAAPRRVIRPGDRTWQVVGLRLKPASRGDLERYRSSYRGGLSVLAVRPDSPAARQGIRRGDILVGMHHWETVALENVEYVLNRPDFADLQPLKFFIVRGRETLYGHMTVSAPRRRR